MTTYWDASESLSRSIEAMSPVDSVRPGHNCFRERLDKSREYLDDRDFRFSLERCPTL